MEQIRRASILTFLTLSVFEKKLLVLCAKGGGGTGGSSGGSTGSSSSSSSTTSSTSGRTSDGAEDDSIYEAEIIDEELKMAIIYASIAVFTLIGSVFAFRFMKREFRKKVDLELHLGIALASIINGEGTYKNEIVAMGLGTNHDVVEQWIDDMWEFFDKQYKGTLKKNHVQVFLD